MVIAGPVLAVSGMLVAGVWLEGDGRTVAAVGVGIVAGVAAYSAIFTWLGLTTGHPLGFALVYVFIWEGVLSSLLSGTRYLSVRAYTMTLMEGIDTSRLHLFEEQAIEMQCRHRRRHRRDGAVLLADGAPTSQHGRALAAERPVTPAVSRR